MSYINRTQYVTWNTYLIITCPKCLGTGFDVSIKDRTPICLYCAKTGKVPIPFSEIL